MSHPQEPYSLTRSSSGSKCLCMVLLQLPSQEAINNSNRWAVGWKKNLQNVSKQRLRGNNLSHEVTDLSLNFQTNTNIDIGGTTIVWNQNSKELGTDYRTYLNTLKRKYKKAPTNQSHNISLKDMWKEPYLTGSFPSK